MTQDDLLKDFADKITGNQQQEQVQETPQEETTEEVVNEESQTEEPQAQETEEVVEEQSEEPTEEPEKETEEEGFQSDNSWLDESEEAVEEKKDGDFELYSDIAGALGVESFGDKDTVINHLKELQDSKVNLEKELAAAKEETPFANDDIKIANELAKGGGDFQKYLELSNIDYNGIEDDLLLTEIVAKPHLGDNPEEIQNFLNGLTDSQKKIEANRIRKELSDKDAAKKQGILDNARNQKESMDNGIKDVLKGTKSMYGLEMTGHMKKKSFESLTSEKGLFSHIIGKDGQVDYKKAVEAQFILSNFKDIVSTALTNERNKSKAEEFKEVTKPNMNQQKGSTSAPKKENKGAVQNWLDGMRNQTYNG